MPADKRVFDVRVTLAAQAKHWRMIAVSADATLPEFCRTIQGAFEVRGHLRSHDLTIAGTRYHGGKGSRTRLRSVIAVGDRVELHSVVEGQNGIADVMQSYEVPSRRHHPKVLAGGDGESADWGSTHELERATWNAQDAARYGNDSDHDEASSAGHGISESETLGYFAAIVSGPMVMPSEWMPLVNGDRVWENMIEAQSGIARIMGAYNSVAGDLQEGKRLTITDAPAFCDGYLRGMALRMDEWRPLVKHERLGMTLRLMYALATDDADDFLVQALREDPAMYAQMLETLPAAVADIYAYWRSRESRMSPMPTIPGAPIRRATPKISPNDPCPCGSGKKFKRCCSPVRSVT